MVRQCELNRETDKRLETNIFIDVHLLTANVYNIMGPPSRRALQVCIHMLIATSGSWLVSGAMTSTMTDSAKICGDTIENHELSPHDNSQVT